MIEILFSALVVVALVVVVVAVVVVVIVVVVVVVVRKVGGVRTSREERGASDMRGVDGYLSADRVVPLFYFLLFLAAMAPSAHLFAYPFFHCIFRRSAEHSCAKIRKIIADKQTMREADNVNLLMSAWRYTLHCLSAKLVLRLH